MYSYFTFAIGFCGNSTIPQLVAGGVTQLVTRCVVDQETNAERALESSIVNDVTLLKHTPVVYLARDNNGNVYSRAIGHHHPPVRVWGFDFTFCGSDNCPWEPSDNDWLVNRHNGSVSMVCTRCNWRSRWVHLEEVDFIRPWGPAHPRVFTYPFPPTPPQQTFFVTRGLHEQSQVGGQKRKTAEGEKQGKTIRKERRKKAKHRNSSVPLDDPSQ
jgi:hypothetical protein